MKQRVEAELPSLPLEGFVEFVDQGGLKIGRSAIGDEALRYAAGTNAIVTAAAEAGGVGVVDVVVTGFAMAGGGDLYDDALVYSCFEVSVDLEKKQVLGFDDAPCAAIVVDAMGGEEHISFDQLQ